MASMRDVEQTNPACKQKGLSKRPSRSFNAVNQQKESDSKMNEEQMKWIDAQIGVLNAAKTANSVTAYEEAVGKLQEAVDTCPEP